MIALFKIIVLLFMMTVCCGNSTFGTVVARVVQEVNPRQIMVHVNWRDRNKKNFEFPSVLKKIFVHDVIQKIPVILANFSKKQSARRGPNNFRYNHDFSSPLHIIFIQEDSSRKSHEIYFYSIMNLIFGYRGQPYMSKTRILLLFMKQKPSSMAMEDMLKQQQTLLKKLHFLAFSQYSSFPSRTLGIFPDHWTKLSGSNIRVGTIDWPKNYILTSGVSFKIAVHPYLYKLWSTFLQRANATQTIVQRPPNTVNIRVFIRQLRLDVDLSRAIVDPVGQTQDICFTGSQKYVGLVALVKSESLDNNWSEKLPIFYAMVFIGFAVEFLFRYQGQRWSTLDTFRVFLGMSLGDRPLYRLMPKMLYLFLGLLPIFGLSDIVAKLIKINVLIDESPLVQDGSPLKGLNETSRGLTICSLYDPIGLRILSEHSTNDLRDFSNRLERCVQQKDGSFRSDLMILDELNAQVLMRYKPKSMGPRNFQIIDLNLPIIVIGIPFARTSLMVRDGLAETNSRVLEAGLPERWKLDYKQEKKPEELNEENSSELLVSLIGLFVVGWTLAILGFMFEMITPKRYLNQIAVNT